MKHLPTPATGLEEMTDRALLKILEECNGEDSPIFIECLRRLMEFKIHPPFKIQFDSAEKAEAWMKKAEADEFSRQMRHDEIKRATMPEDICQIREATAEDIAKYPKAKGRCVEECYRENEKGERVD